ncbi:MAG TPA: agmatine deiminase family protein [Verrucomicrobiae bacterium]|nr:agmatine deiminase family protein [Verrucomicrobiae bacterium]
MQKTKATNSPPAALGYAMPAEWEPHAATWLAWPHHQADWPGKMETVRWAYGEMARKISQGETVRMLVRHKAEESIAASCLQRAGCDLGKIEFIVYSTNRGWMRDTGPVFVKRVPKSRGQKARPETAIVHFHFNAWARDNFWRKDRRIPEMAARLLGKKLFHAVRGPDDPVQDTKSKNEDFVLEGGGVEVNGRGTLLTTEDCYLHPTVQVRNPGMTRAQYDEAFKNYLGANNPLWLLKGPEGDDTHGHVDDICRFVNRKTLVLVREKNPRDINYRPLAENWERVRSFRLEDGSKPEIVPLPMPGPLYFAGRRLPASYANFYIANACVIVPTFNDPNDRVALGVLGELFRDRPVVGIHAVDLVLGSGSLHCLTQQQPA